MTVHVQRLFPLRQARARRHTFAHYLQLDGSRYLLGGIILLCLMSMIALGQTGVVATRGYAIVALEQQRTLLLRERSQLQLRYAAAQSLERIRQRAEAIGLRPRARDQVRYITVEQRPAELVRVEPPTPAQQVAPTPGAAHRAGQEQQAQR